ncbi:hypothetical protein HDV57DRAFT_488156 [Trichoderma longibrachiatum]
MKVDENLWYLISFFGFIGTLLGAWLTKHLVPNPHLFFKKHLQYATFLPWVYITRLQVLLMAIFLLANVLISLIPILPFPSWLVIQKRAAFACMANVTLLCVGNRGPFLNALNISRRWLMIIHIWVGIVATLEAILHSTIAVSLSIERDNNSMLRSGWIGLGLILGATFLSIPVLQTIFGRCFIWLHRILAGGSVGMILWHILGTSSRLSCIIFICSCGFWFISALSQVLRVLFFTHSGRVVSCKRYPDVIQLTIKLKTAVKPYPGCYFYVFGSSHFLRFNFLHSYSAIPLAYLPEESRGVSEITLLILSHDFFPQSFRIRHGQRVLLDGPYGKRLDLRGHQNVVLAAKGAGLAAILPLALDLAARRDHDNRVRDQMQQIFMKQQTVVRKLAISDGPESEKLSQRKAELAQEQSRLSTAELHRDSVKKVDIFWSLESNDQMDWAQDYLQGLKSLDPQNKLLVVWCGYPYPRNGGPPFDQSRHWLCLDPVPSRSFDDIISSQISEERRRLAGSLLVATSGSKSFRMQMRRSVLNAMEDRAITLVEAECQPLGPHFKEENRTRLTAERLTRLNQAARERNRVPMLRAADVNSNFSVSLKSTSQIV